MSGVVVESKLLPVNTNTENNVEDVEMDDSGGAVEKSRCGDDEAEEGEISDKDEDDDNPNTRSVGLTRQDFARDQSGHYENRAGAFISGIDFFGREEQLKLEERAKRFGLDQQVRVPTEQQLTELYNSLNMKLSEGLDKSYRLSAVHMRGTENMSTQDVFAYFEDYAPSFIEWITDYACNVVWLHEGSASRALIGLSQPISGLEAYHAKANPFHKTSPAEGEDSREGEDSKDASGDKEEVVMVVAEIEGEGGENDIMVVDKQKETIADKNNTEMEYSGNAVKASDIEVPIPPGRWRKGIDHLKAKCILLRFAMRSDKKFLHNEKLSEYYKKHGNPNYGGLKGIITASRKRRYQRASEFPVKVFDDDVGDERDFPDAQGDEDNKNPWGSLARSWNRLDKTRGTQPEVFEEERVVLPRREITLTSASRREAKAPTHNSASRPVFERLGNVAPRPSNIVAPRLGNVAPRLGNAAPQPPPHSSSSEQSESSDSEDESWTRRSKAPRMRMYADEEEDRQRRMTVSLRVSSGQRARSPEDLRGRLERSRGEAAASVWSRLRAAGGECPAPRAQDNAAAAADTSSNSSSSGGGSSSNSSSSSDTASSSSSDNSDSDADSDAHIAPVAKKGVTDLRAKLDMKKSLRQPVAVRQKSPLRIEIDNDEYYRLIGSD